MTTYKRRSSGKYKPDWDRGNGWMRTKDEWQDYDKAEDKTVSVAELQDLWCPASGSTITVETDIEGLTFDLEVGAKEYNGTRKRKPTRFAVTYTLNGETAYYPFIPLPNAWPERLDTGAWHFKQSWSQAVKTLTKEILPAYAKHCDSMCLRSVVQRQGDFLPPVSESTEG